MAILDHRGNPVNIGKLTTELAAPSIGSVRSPFFDSAVAGLTPQRLASILRAADDGDPVALLTLAEEIEEKDLHYSSVLRTRKLAVTRLKVSVEAASDDPKDVEIADEVTKLTKKAAFRELMSDQMDALGRSFAVNEIEWLRTAKRWTPKKYVRRDQRSFQFDRETGNVLRLRDNANLVDGLALEPFKFIVHTPKLKTGLTIRGGLARLAAVAFMCKSYTLKDWLTFAEVFGMPIRVGKYDAAATDDQKAALLRAVTNIGTDAAAIIPTNMMLEIIAASTSSGGETLFMGLADWLDRQVSKGVLGQTSTSDAQPTGIGSGVADNANEVRSDICDDDGFKLACTLQRDLCDPFVMLNFGEPVNGFPTLIIGAEQREDLKLFTEAITPLIDRGLRVEESEVRDKFKLREPAKGAIVLSPASVGSPFGGGGAPQPTDEEDVDEEDVADPIPPKKPVKKEDKEMTSVRDIQRDMALELTARVMRGETLTADQRAIVEIFAAQHGDEIDQLASENASNWRRVLNPATDQLLALVNKSTSFEDMLAQLKEAKLDLSDFQRSLATATFTARGGGDAGNT